MLQFLLCVLLILVAVPGWARADQPNAADAYKQAIKAAHLDEMNEADVNATLGSGYRQKIALDKCLDDNQAAFKSLAAGAAIDRCRFAPDVGIIDKNLGPYDNLRDLALLWFTDGLREVKRGHADAGLDCMVGAIKIGLQIQEDRVLAARTTGQDLQLAGFLAMLKFLQREQPPAAALLKQVAAAQALTKLRLPFSTTITAERGWTLASADDLASGGTDNRAFLGLSGAQIRAVLMDFHTIVGRAYGLFLQAANATNFHAMAAAELTVAKAYRKEHVVPGSPAGIALRLAGALIPSFSHTWQDDQVGRAELSALPALLALKAWKLQHKTYPKTLAQLRLSPTPRDPFGSGPLKYYVASHGSVLYSVGPDHHDDGGLHELVDYAHYQNKDIVMRLP